MNVKRILRCFELLSGLRINFSKSLVAGEGVEENNMEEVADLLRCRVKSLPIMYLGLPLGANPRRIKTWQPIIDKVKKRLSLWKRKCLSIGGRITLIKSTLSNLPVSFMSLWQSSWKKYKEFLWGDLDNKRKLHLLGWNSVSKGKKLGGIVIRRSVVMKAALLCKWYWRYSSEKHALEFSPKLFTPTLPSSGKASKFWKDIVSTIYWE